MLYNMPTTAVISSDPPSLPDNLPDYTEIIESNPVILPCPAVGTPTPEITWYKDGQVITENQVGVTFLDDGSLELDSVKAEDSGTYICKAVNEAGEIKQEVDLKILGELLDILQGMNIPVCTKSHQPPMTGSERIVASSPWLVLVNTWNLKSHLLIKHLHVYR